MTADNASIHTNSNTLSNAPEAPDSDAIKLSLVDINPFPPVIRVLRRWNNIAILFPSGENVSCVINYTVGCNFIIQAFSFPSLTVSRTVALGQCLISIIMMR
jgi:cytosine/uracil/thiamine/allantoin permease